MQPTNEQAVTLAPPSTESSETKEYLRYELAATKAMMAISIEMKEWLEENYFNTGLSDIEQRVETNDPTLKVADFSKRISLFRKLLDLQDFTDQVRAGVLQEWHEVSQQYATTYGKDFSDVDYPADVTDEEMKQLCREFKHDISSPTGMDALAREAISIGTGENKSTQTVRELLQSIRSCFQGTKFKPVAEKMDTVIAKQDEMHLSSGDKVQIIKDMYEVLQAFSLETGGQVSEPILVSQAEAYLKYLLNRWTVSRDITLELEFDIQDSARDKKTYINKTMLVRVLLNALSNIQKFLAEKDKTQNPEAFVVRIGLTATDSQSILEISDHGPGFPSEIPNSEQVVLGRYIHKADIAMGKTEWKHASGQVYAQGTGTGLFGIQRLINKVSGELVAGNRYEDNNKVGASLFVITPVL